MRGAVEGLPSPDPLGARMPAVYAADALTQRLTAAYDEVIAPVYATLDNLWCYFDPDLAPADFVEWLGGWVAADAGRQRPLDRSRASVAGAVRRHRIRGTAAGLRADIEDAFGVTAEIVESGGTAWSGTPGSALPGSAEPSLVVRVRVADPGAVPVSRLRAFVEANRPAHVPCSVEVLAGEAAR
jgi:phage tail-like protein